jgi:hypothetical protein
VNQRSNRPKRAEFFFCEQLQQALETWITLNFNEFDSLHLQGEAEFKKKVRKRFGVISSDIMKFQGGGGGLLKCLSKDRLKKILLVTFKDSPEAIRNHRWLYCFVARKEHFGMNNYRTLHGLDSVPCNEVDHTKVYQLFAEFLRRKGEKIIRKNGDNRSKEITYCDIFDELNPSLKLPEYFREKDLSEAAIIRKGYDGFFAFRKTLSTKDAKLFDEWLSEKITKKKIPKIDVQDYIQGKLNLCDKYKHSHKWLGDAKLLLKLTHIDNKHSYAKTDIYTYPKELLKNLIEEYEVKSFMPPALISYLWGVIEVLPCPSWSSFDGPGEESESETDEERAA